MAEDKPIIQYEDFCKLDLRVAKVVEASDHPNADKLIVLKIDLGGEHRQIIAGMRGLERQGMLLAASRMEGETYADVVLLTTDRDVPAGAPVS